MCKNSPVKTMTMTAGKLAIVASLFTGAAFTATPAHAEKDTLGLIIGAVGGGFLGNQFGGGSGRTIATAVGAVGGGLVGQSFGRSADRADRLYEGRGGGYYDSGYRSSTVYYSEPAPQRVYYVPSYERRVRRVEVMPAPVYHETSYVVDNSYGNSRSNDQYCREYNQGVTVGGRTQPSYGTACLMPDGSWKIQ